MTAMPLSFRFLGPLTRGTSVSTLPDDHDVRIVHYLVASRQLPVLPPQAVTVSGSNSVEPQCGRGVSQALLEHLTIPHIYQTQAPREHLGSLMLSQLCIQDRGAAFPIFPVPSTSPQLRVEEPEGPRSSETRLLTKLILQEVLPDKGAYDRREYILLYLERTFLLLHFTQRLGITGFAL
jgi:hypothetical protein